MVMEGVTSRELAKALGVSDSSVRNACYFGRIEKLPNGRYDPVACREAWIKSTDPSRSKVKTQAVDEVSVKKTVMSASKRPKPTPRSSLFDIEPNVAPDFDVETGGPTVSIKTEAEALSAIALIQQVLRSEGVEAEEIDYNAARTADTILKAYERDLKIKQRQKELVPIAQVQTQVGRAFTGFRQAIQRLPSRHVPHLAAELGVDPGLLESLLNKAIAAELDDLSSPLVRT